MKKDTSASTVSRRAFLGAAGLTSASALLAACGESSPEPDVVSSGTAGPELEAAIEPAREAAAQVTALAPSAAAAVPKAGDQRQVPVAILPTEFAGGRLFALFANAFLEAGRRSDGRYQFTRESIDVSDISSRWSMSEAVDAVSGAAPDLVVYFGTDLQDLLAHEKLLPLDDFLAADPDFDPAAYWPGALGAGRFEGSQYGLPFAVSPFHTLINRELAAELGIELPEPTLDAFTADAFLQIALAFHVPDPPGGGRGTQGILGNVSADPHSRGDFGASPSPNAVLLSALGALRDDRGGFTPLEGDRARDAVAFIRDLVKRDQLIPVGSLNYFAYIEPGKWGMGFGTIAFSDIGELRADNRIYPFPNFGSGRNPTFTFLAGVLSSTNDPEVAYDALRHFYAATAADSVLPPFRVDAPAVRDLVPELRPGDEDVVVHLLENAGSYNLSRREMGVILNTIARDVLVGDLSPEQGLRNVVQELEALPAGE